MLKGRIYSCVECERSVIVNETDAALLNSGGEVQAADSDTCTIPAHAEMVRTNLLDDACDDGRG